MQVIWSPLVLPCCGRHLTYAFHKAGWKHDDGVAPVWRYMMLSAMTRAEMLVGGHSEDGV